MKLLDSQQVKIPLRTSWHGRRSSVAGRKQDARSTFCRVSPINLHILLLTALVSVLGVLYVENLRVRAYNAPPHPSKTLYSRYNSAVSNVIGQVQQGGQFGQSKVVESTPILLQANNNQQQQQQHPIDSVSEQQQQQKKKEEEDESQLAGFQDLIASLHAAMDATENPKPSKTSYIAAVEPQLGPGAVTVPATANGKASQIAAGAASNNGATMASHAVRQPVAVTAAAVANLAGQLGTLMQAENLDSSLSAILAETTVQATVPAVQLPTTATAAAAAGTTVTGGLLAPAAAQSTQQAAFEGAPSNAVSSLHATSSSDDSSSTADATAAAATISNAAMFGSSAAAPASSIAVDNAPLLPRNRLLLATHSRLLWYFPDTDQHIVLHEGEGVHYGMFPGAGEPVRTVWTVIRPHNWRPTTNKEYLVELDMVTGSEVQRVAIPSRFTHDVVRHDDSVFVCDTGNGRILQLSFPGMIPVRSLEVFTLADHPNTLAPLADDNFLVVLHNLGQSDVVRVNISAAHVIQNPTSWLASQTANLDNIDSQSSDSQTAHKQQANLDAVIMGRVQRVGEKAHGLVPWQGAYIMLDSDNGALIAMDLISAPSGQGFNIVRLWKAPEEGVFLKGLAIVDDVAYFGISPWAPRSARNDPQSNNELAAFDLVAGELLWRRQVPTAGLLNIIGAPHLSVASTYLPSYTGKAETDVVQQHHNSPEVAVAMQSLTKLGYPPKVGGYWSSGLPYLEMNLKSSKTPWDAGLQLPLLLLNVSQLQADVLALPPEAWNYQYQAKYSAVMAGREGNQAAFKPGVEGIVLLFSDNDGSGPVYKFPAYDYFAPALEPLLEAILGKHDLQHIIRLQLALMRPGMSDIKIHVDSGGYAVRGHRIHIPVFTHPNVAFDVCPHRYVPDPAHSPGEGEPQRILDIQECFKIPAVEGFAFELNNRAAHRVANLSPIDRVHVVIDLCQGPHPRISVPPGTVCDYDMKKGLLCKYSDNQQQQQQQEGSALVQQQHYSATAAKWLEPAAAAAKSGLVSGDLQQQLQEQLDADQGSGYTTADDTILAAAETTSASAKAHIDLENMQARQQQQQQPPFWAQQGNGVTGAVQQQQHSQDSQDDGDIKAPLPEDLLLPGQAAVNGQLLMQPAVSAHTSGLSGAGGIVGTVANTRTSSWVTATMQSHGGIAAA